MKVRRYFCVTGLTEEVMKFPYEFDEDDVLMMEMSGDESLFLAIEHNYKTNLKRIMPNKEIVAYWSDWERIDG